MTLKVDQALIKSFIDADFGIAIAHENVDYEPAHGTPYVEITVFDSGSEPFTINGWDENIGLFQAILRYPTTANGKPAGAIPAKTMAESILSHFAIQSQHTYEDQLVRILSHSRGPGAPEDGWYKIVLRMRYQAFTAR